MTITRPLLRALISGSLAIALVAGSPSAAHADARGKKILACLDKKATHAKDLYFLYDMVIHEPGKESRTMGMKVWTMGTMRLVHFTSPGDVKGMKVLIRSRTKMYVYLKAFRKIRRITSHMKKQSLFGADYNYDDQSTVVYGDVFEADFVSETPKLWKLRATAKKGADTPYAHIELQLRKPDCLPVKLLYYNDQGKHIKTETRVNYACKQGHCTAAVMKMVDHTRNNHWTKMVRKEWKANIGLSKRRFSRRALQRSH